MTAVSCHASIDALAKRGTVHTFTLSVPSEFLAGLQVGTPLRLGETLLPIKEIDDEYLTFEIELKDLLSSSLGECTVGDTVFIQREAD